MTRTMADLLECLIQMKALADTPRRLAQRLPAHGPDAAPAVPVLKGLIEYEAWLLGCVEVGVASAGALVAAEPRDGASSVPGGDESPSALLARFGMLREVTVARLDTLTAAQLAARVFVSGRGPTTVADLVALALAHDTDGIARIVRASSRPTRT
jgi:hypothetical protein